MAKKRVGDNHGSPEIGRAKRQAAADDNAAGATNEAPTGKRPRGRPPRGLPVKPLTPKPIAAAAAGKLRKATPPANQNPSTSEAAATKDPRVSRRKRFRSSSPCSTTTRGARLNNVAAPRKR
ncbi:hypothetical protein MRX96_049162 [Rhipicephalus microplus]